MKLKLFVALLMGISFAQIANAEKVQKKTEKKIEKAVEKTAAAEKTEKIQFSSEQSQVEFDAVGKPSFLRIHGTGNKLKGNIEKTKAGIQGELRFPLETLDTKNDMRNTHMKEKYLEVAKFPEAVLKIKKISAAGDPTAADAKGSFEGDMTLHGVTKPVSGTFEKSGASVKASFDLKLTDYTIDIPKYAGITVAEDVKVQITLADVKVIQ